MKHLHAGPVKVHGSLKSGNLVVDSRWVLKVTDYGVNSVRDRFGCTKNLKAKGINTKPYTPYAQSKTILCGIPQRCM